MKLIERLKNYWDQRAKTADSDQSYLISHQNSESIALSCIAFELKRLNDNLEKWNA